jgi:hypothetical protein
LPELLRATMQLDAQLWNDLLWLSGGLLELSKRSFHHIHFDFMPDGTSMMRAGKIGTPLQVHDESTNESVTILAKSAYQSHTRHWDTIRPPAGLIRHNCKFFVHAPTLTPRWYPQAPVIGWIPGCTTRLSIEHRLDTSFPIASLARRSSTKFNRLPSALFLPNVVTIATQTGSLFLHLSAMAVAALLPFIIYKAKAKFYHS